MKFSTLLPLVVAASAFVVPSEQVLEDVTIEDNHRETSWYDHVVSKKNRFISDAKESFDEYYHELKEQSKESWDHITECSGNAVDEAFEQANEVADSARESVYDAASGIRSWVESGLDDVYEVFEEDEQRPPHRRPGHGHKPHHPPHHKPNLTVYQLIAGSKYTTKLAKLISEHDDLVEALNSTKANYTIFAPTDKALAKIPEDAPKPSKKQLKAFLSYHVIPDLYPAGRLLASHTFPTLLKSDSLGSEPLPQRMAVRFGIRGLTVNFYSRVIAINIFGTNGVIHGIDTPLFPPPSAIEIIDLFPAGFSTLELGLSKTGLLDKLNTTDHAGGTFFAPNNDAFAKLGPKANAFLFSKYGLKYLKALLEYHVVPDNTLYSDAYYKASPEDELINTRTGLKHVDLPTLLDDRSLSIDIARWGGFIEIKINGFNRVDVQDVVAEDGVIHVLTNVIVPPKKLGGEDVYWKGEELSVDDLKERLEPFVPKSDL
jgi:uncharacterized surface protein with fasciclin (FAS1) repeats